MDALLDFLALRALPGVEQVGDGSYRRALRLPHGPAEVTLTPLPGYVAATLRLTDVRDLAPAVARCRRLLDLDADPEAVDSTLAADPALTAVVDKEPGVRVPRAVDGFEMAVRAIVGQQVSVAGARTVLTRLIAAANPVDDEIAPTTDGSGELRLAFPSAAELLALPDQAFGMPAARRRDDPDAGPRGRRRRLDLDPGSGPGTTSPRN